VKDTEDKLSENMNILQVSTSFKPSWETGGTVRVVYEISRELVKRKHNVTVYTTDRGQKRVDVLKNRPVNVDGILVYYFRNLSNYLAMKMKIVTPYYLLFVAKNIEKYDVIHVHEHRTIMTVIIHHYSKKYGIPYIIQSHGSVGYINKGLFKKIFDWLWGYTILHDASKLIALTQTEFNQYVEMGVPKKKIEIIPNGINLSDYQNLPERGRFKMKYSIGKDEKVILFLGRINKIKGLDLLIKSFYEILKEIKDIKLVIVGPDDGFMNDLKKILKELKLEHEILVIGPVYDKDKLNAYVDAYVYVLPSIYETFPMTVIESLACNTPAIITDRCGLADLFKQNNIGYIVKYKKSNLVQSLTEILLDEEIRENFSRNCRDVVEEKFNLKNSVKNLELLYDNII
jgi:glycosyltransferase involved in cell wall biosynthesis